MTYLYNLADVKVDVMRCQIIKERQVVTIEPKVMDVLHYLIKHQGVVVSQETLFNALWPNTTFNTGSIQRCITILRKALGDNAKNQKFIITHPKRGYSLAIEVEKNTTENRISSLMSVKNITTKITFSLCFFIFLAMIIYLKSNVIHKENTEFKGYIEPVTTSHSYDFMPVYSPDGLWLAFLRQNKDGNHIWLKNLKNNQFHQLTRISENYRQLNWKRSSQNIIFSVKSDLGDFVGEISIETGDIVNNELFKLNIKSELWKIQSSGEKIYYMSTVIELNKAPSTQLSVFDSLTQKHDVLFESDREFTPYRIALSPDETIIALAGEDSSNEVHIRLFDIETGELFNTIHKFKLGFTEISWHPSGKKLLVLHQNRLNLLSINGDISALPYHHFQKIYNPVFNHDASSISVSMTQNDRDIYQYESTSKQFKKIIDSTGEDALARLSNTGNHITYISTKTGYQQVFIFKDGESKLIYNNHSQRPIYRSPVWSNNAEVISFITFKKIHFYDVKSEKLVSHEIDESITSVLDWYQFETSLLVSQKVNNITRFAKYNMLTKEIRNIADSGINYNGRLNNKDQIIYMKNHFVFNEMKKVESLEPSNNMVFPIEEGFIVQNKKGITLQNQDEKKIIIKQTPEFIDELIDVGIKGKYLLFNSFNSSGANIVKLH